MNRDIHKQRVKITPLNQPTGGVYRPDSFPNIEFMLAKNNAFLDPRTLRLNATFQYYNGSGTIPNADGSENPNNVPNTKIGGATNGAAINNSIGVKSVFDEMSIGTLVGRNLETIRSANRYIAASRPFLHSSMELNNGVGLEDPTVTNKSVSNATTCNTAFSISIDVPLGMFESQKYINMSDKGFAGLTLNLLLAPNNVVLQPFFNYNETKNPVAFTSTTPFIYTLRDVNLTYDLLIPSDKLYNSLPSSGVINYQTVNTLHSSLLSSDQTIPIKLGSNAVVSITHSMIPSIHLNNIKRDSFLLDEPRDNATTTTDGVRKPIKEVQYLRAGVLFPYDYFLNSEAQLDLNGSVPGVAETVQAQIMKPAQNSVSLYDNFNNKFNPNTNIGLLTNLGNAGGFSQSQVKTSAADPKQTFLLGFPTDSTRLGVSYKDREYAIRIQSELNNTSVNSFMTFSRFRQVAQFSPAGLNIIG
tara:strand:+ start:419 stop:1831 length:1413 start_codon:yes stop_codon:yes gene_type:complete